MKGFDEKRINVEQVGDSEGYDMAFNANSSAFLFDIVFNQMYRQPIKSIVREITSNCFDAHAEIGSTDAVIVEFDNDEGGDYIAFHDFGPGISPDRMEKVYSKPLTSSKRDSNNQIGFFGLGSKSPLSYDDSFLLETNIDGTHYEYMIHKGQSGTPRIEFLLSTPTDKVNGSTVKIYFKEKADKYKFEEAVVDQLLYFDNVFVKSKTTRFVNDYKLYVGESFKYSSNVDLKTNLHICIGKVKYPIDWQAIGFSKPIELPFGLKFEIGELPITPERESIRYIDIQKDGESVKTADLVITKIEAFLKEINTLAGEEIVEHNNIYEWYQADNARAFVKMFDKNIEVTKHVKARTYIYAPFEPIKEIFPVPINFYAGVKILKTIYKHDLKRDITFDEGSLSDISIKFCTEWLVFRTKISGSVRLKPIMQDYIKHLSMEKGNINIAWVKEIPLQRKERHWIPLFTFKFKGLKSRKLDYSKINKLKAYMYYKALMRKELIINTIDWDTLEIPEDFVTKWKEENKTTRVTVKGVDNVSVAIYDIRSGNPRTGLKKVEVPLATFDLVTGFILYGFGSSLDSLLRWSEVFRLGKWAEGKACSIIQINQKDEKYFILRKNAINVDSFMNNHEVFKEVATAAFIKRSKIWDFKLRDATSSEGRINIIDSKLNLVFTPLVDTVKKLHTQYKNTVNLDEGTESRRAFISDVISVAETNNWIDEPTKKDVKKCENYLNDLNLLPFVSQAEEAVPYIAEYIQLKGKKVNPEWVAPEPWVMELIKDSIDKWSYLTENAKIALAMNYSWSTTGLSKVIQRCATNSRDKARLLGARIDKGNYEVRQIGIFKNYHDQKTRKD